MKVELSIADDRELRQAIKDEIKGVVVSIARSEIKNILADVVREGVVPKTPADIEKIWQTEISKEVSAALKSAGGYWPNETIKQVVREEVSKILKELFAQGRILS